MAISQSKQPPLMCMLYEEARGLLCRRSHQSNVINGKNTSEVLAVELAELDKFGFYTISTELGRTFGLLDKRKQREVGFS